MGEPLAIRILYKPQNHLWASMNFAGKPIDFIPTQYRQPPPIKYFGKCEVEGIDLYTWYITEDEYLRLNKLFGRDFQDVDLGGTILNGVPAACRGCGKYTEFIDWVWTAIYRGVHSSEFLFKALQNGRQGDEGSHDVYCSECGLLTVARSDNDAEGGAADIFLAGKLNRVSFPKSRRLGDGDGKNDSNFSNPVRWGKWWLDNNGRVQNYGGADSAAKNKETQDTASSAKDGDNSVSMPTEGH